MDGLKYCAKNECNIMIIMPRSHKHLSSSANGPSDVSVTVNINAEFHLSSICWQLTPELNAFQGILSPSNVSVRSSAVYTVPSIIVEYLHVL